MDDPKALILPGQIPMQVPTLEDLSAILSTVEANQQGILERLDQLENRMEQIDTEALKSLIKNLTDEITTEQDPAS